MKKLLFAIIMLSTLFTFISCDVISGTPETPSDATTECEHKWSEATCQAAKKCAKCGELQGKVSDHNYTDATCKSPMTCTVCGKTSGEAGEHDYADATCTSAKICKTCGVWFGRPLGHNYSPANCTSPKTCSTCGHEVGDPEHDYTDATCTTPKSCSLCGATQGDSLGHKTDTEIVEATCSIDGYERTFCTVCGTTFNTTVIPKTNHSELSFVYNGDATATVDGTATAKCPFCNYTATKTLVGSSALIAEAFADKKISILGDSISTYKDVTAGIAADTTNSTIRDNIVWNGYNPGNSTFGGTSVDSTWWQRTINALGATRLVNNSYSGRTVSQALAGPCTQLHDDTGDNAGETPDIIFVYLGTNDIFSAAMGDGSKFDMATIQTMSDKTSYVPQNLAESYAIMLYRIQKAYPDAEIYCLTTLERSDASIELTHAVNRVICDVVALFDGVHLVDIGVETPITRDNPDYITYMPKDTGNKSLHPSVEGMREISRVLLKVLVENSRYMSEAFDDLLSDALNDPLPPPFTPGVVIL